MVSIIVPVYNAEAVIGKCIDSILKQTYTDFELILLNDGSKDGTAGILDAYADKDDRIRVIHKENSGVSDSRNQGLALARGEYIQFLDSDDWIIPEATALFVHAMEEQNCDLVISDFYRVVGEKVAEKGAIDQEGLLDLQSFAEQMIRRPADFYYGVLWNKFFKKSIIDAYGIRMDENISWCEDFIFIMQYLSHVRNVFVLKAPLYYYVKTEGSLVSQGMSITRTIEMKQIVFKHYNAFFRKAFGEELYEKKRLQVYYYFVDFARDGALVTSRLGGRYKLGEERSPISSDLLTASGFFFDAYRERVLYDRIFEIVANRYELSKDDVKLLYFFSQSEGVCTREEIGKVLSISQTKVTRAIGKLTGQDLIRSEKKGVYLVTSEANAILSEILFLSNDLEQVRYASFTQEEIEQFEKLQKRRNENIRRSLT